MAVTDLTGYTWVINSNPQYNNYILVDIDFESNGTHYTRFYLSQEPDPMQQGTVINLYYGSTKVATQGSAFPPMWSWTNQAYRTITFETAPTGDLLTWLEANGTLIEPIIGYDITFNSNGGNAISPITGATELPTPLPTPTKANSKFVGWYYDSGLTQRAYAGETITANVTLYAKWYSSYSDFATDVADAIRAKSGMVDEIVDTDFADKIRSL